MTVEEWAKECQLAEHMRTYYHVAYQRAQHDDFHRKYPVAGRGNFVAAMVGSMVTNQVPKELGFSLKKSAVPGMFAEAFIWHVSLTDESAAGCLTDMLNIVAELLDWLQIHYPARWYELSFHASATEFLKEFFPKERSELLMQCLAE